MPEEFDDTRLIHTEEIDAWASRLHALPDATEVQSLTFQNFTESCLRLMQRRVEMHSVALQFHRAGMLNTTTMSIQQDFYYRTEIFFHGFYSCLSQLANIVARSRARFGTSVRTSSNKQFIASVCALDASRLNDTADVLEAARSHRTFLDHPVSNHVSNWITISTGDIRELQVIHYGESGRNNNIPEGATRGNYGAVMCEWYKPTPDPFDIELHLKELIEYVVTRLEEIVESSSQT